MCKTHYLAPINWRIIFYILTSNKLLMPLATDILDDLSPVDRDELMELINEPDEKETLSHEEYLKATEMAYYFFKKYQLENLTSNIFLSSNQRPPFLSDPNKKSGEPL